MEAESSTTSSSQSGRFSLEFTGKGSELALVMLKNLFLTIITLGIYRPWAKTNFRRYLWENVQFMGDRAAYVGTGEELFYGWLKLFALIAGLFGLSNIVKVVAPFLSLPLSIAGMFLWAFVFAIATYSGLRYRLSRTTWRQIRFGVDKDKEQTKSFLKLYAKGVLLSIVTLGFYYSYFQNQKRAFLVNRMRFGTVHFSYDGADKEYFMLNAKGLLLSIITLGFYGPWYMASVMRFKMEHTHFQGARMEFTMSGKDIFFCTLIAYLGAIFTFGLAVPWIFAWGLGKIVENIHVVGSLDFAQVHSLKSDGSAMADDIVAEYDLDLGF
ncbi:YjgN family protein [Bdellovibrio sp. HCB185ZH]|uniref:YjgN family protein n=1 Tax=Bdellovibrio sp. HCB185ZH TaxID=3394235 RepID=UPI0039A4B515